MWKVMRLGKRKAIFKYTRYSPSVLFLIGLLFLFRTEPKLASIFYASGAILHIILFGLPFSALFLWTAVLMVSVTHYDGNIYVLIVALIVAIPLMIVALLDTISLNKLMKEKGPGFKLRDKTGNFVREVKEAPVFYKVWKTFRQKRKMKS
jgi:hypothetical protein